MNFKIVMRMGITLIALLLISLQLVVAQTTKVVGTVVDEQGETIIGALVRVKDKPDIAASTDLEGKFEIVVPDGQKTLVVTYVGMLTQDVTVRPTLRIVMQPDTKVLDEVVVTGMLKVDKRLFTGATDKVDAEKAKLDGVLDVSRSLEGRSAGVSVQNISGTFGTAPKIRVRGATSIYGNSKPLWVVDGIIIEDTIDITSDQLSSGNVETLLSSAIAGLNADDIESFQILKDGSATSIYGARAMSGVIVITTKKGKMGTSKITYTGEFSTRLTPSYSEFNILNSQEQIGIYKEMEMTGSLNSTSVALSPNSGIYGKMYRMINTPIYGANGDVIGYELDNTTAAKNAYLGKAERRNTDWFDELFSNSLTQNHTIGMSTGTDKSRFYLSMSAYNDPGWYKSSSVERYTGNANGTFYITPKVNLNLIMNGSYRDQRAPGTLGQNVDVVSGEVRRDFDINPYSYALNTSRVLSPSEFYTSNYADFNIHHELANNYIVLNQNDLKFQGELVFKPIKGLDINLLTALRYNKSSQEHNVKDDSNTANAYRAGISPENSTIADRNALLWTDPYDPNARPVSILPEGGIYKRTEYTMRGLDVRASATYNKSFDDIHIMNLFGGMEVNSTDRTATGFTGWGYQYELGGNPFPDANILENNPDYYYHSKTYNRFASFFAQAIYSYEGKYTFNTGGRYEGSNRLGRSRSARWLPTWSVSGAWSIHEESWFDKVFDPLLSFASIKTSYSLTADPPPVSNALAVFTSYNPWRPTSDLSESGIQRENAANKELTFEKKNEFNVGLSLGFLKNRINVETDSYWRNNHDLIGLIYTQGAGGEFAKYANVASMKSRGIEFSVSTKNVQTKNFSWSTDFIFANATTKITDFDSPTNLMALTSGVGFAKEGYPHRGLFSIPFVGLNEEGLPQFIGHDGELTVTGIFFQEFNKLDFLKYEGPSEPTITGSLDNGFTYKNFKLNVFITYAFGNKVRLDPVFSPTYSDLSSMPKEFKNRWMIPGDEVYTNVPVIAPLRLQEKYGVSLYYAYNAYNLSTARVADGGFIRLKDISLAYDFPKKWIGNLIESFHLKLQGTNLFLIYADKKLNGQDPEFANAGGVASPMPKQFTLTVRVGI